MDKISYDTYVSLSANRNRRKEFRAYSNVIPGENGFDFRIVPNPELVVDIPDDIQLENAMQAGNGIERTARRLSFNLDRIFSRHKPVLVAEGDSWFQFPILIDEIVDHLSSKYAILSLAAAGDTAENMVDGPEQSGGREYMTNLRQQKDVVRAFLFSAAGNDVIGEDPVTGKSALFDIINEFNGDETNIDVHINAAVLSSRLDALRLAYTRVINDVHNEPGLQTLPIIVHGYDYTFPYPHVSNDPRNPIHAANNEWLGQPLDRRQFPTATQAQRDLRRKIVIRLIDHLYDMLHSLADTHDNVWVVDCRGAMNDITDWVDEIHGTDEGFGKVAQRFHATLNAALV
ncbi:hypothetical protein TRL7639_00431 [Falsiruegeria litorea R37]|uniref:SGNH hydrolase-type esterase domain-containing protein n=2 Tax=Falsiruegeria litorea TaxID=1280831 RepID=A0A1Y5RK29_9RHOB|nr:hypothetical protein TRL7639_00431 [Falsiruegeria litorea R37]